MFLYAGGSWGIERFKLIDLTLKRKRSRAHIHAQPAYIEMYGIGICECTCCLFGHTESRQPEIIPSDSRESSRTWQHPDKWAQRSAPLLLITFGHAQAWKKTITCTWKTGNVYGNLWMLGMHTQIDNEILMIIKLNRKKELLCASRARGWRKTQIILFILPH